VLGKPTVMHRRGCLQHPPFLLCAVGMAWMMTEAALRSAGNAHGTVEVARRDPAVSAVESSQISFMLLAWTGLTLGVTGSGWLEWALRPLPSLPQGLVWACADCRLG
jgi:hypothetical protein